MIAVVGSRNHKGQEDMESRTFDNNLQLEDILEKDKILIFIHINQLNTKNSMKTRNCIIVNSQYIS